MRTKKNRGGNLSPPGINQNRNQFVEHGGGPLNQKKKDSRVYRKTGSLPLIFWGKSESSLHKRWSLRNCEKGMEFLVWKRYEISDTSLAFLDIKISIEGNGLCTSVYYKPTYSHSYFLCSSSHPSHVKNSKPFKQAATVPNKLIDSQHYKRVKRKNWSHSIHPQISLSKPRS